MDLLQSHEEQMELLKQVRAPQRPKPVRHATRTAALLCSPLPPCVLEAQPLMRACRARRTHHQIPASAMHSYTLARQASELLQGHATNPGAAGLLQSHSQKMDLLKKASRPCAAACAAGILRRPFSFQSLQL
jgi:hypothetical protein